MDGNGNGKRAVLYARCSGDDRGNDGRNLAGQLELARQYATGKGYQIVAEVSEDDKGASGAAFELEGLTKIREMAAAGDFDVLIPREIDRLSRSLAKQLIVEEELLRAGVGIEYVLGEYAETPEGRLQKHIKATIAEYEREKIVERMERGRRLKIRAGNVAFIGRQAYGYRAAVVDGKETLSVVESEARIIRLIFSWYVDGDENGMPLTISRIASRLAGTPTYSDLHGVSPGGRLSGRPFGSWSKAGVATVLKNETYCGRWTYGKCNGRTGKRNPPDRILAVDVPAIVSRETWAAAQVRLAENKANAPRNRKHEYLLARRVTCGECGCKMAGSFNKRVDRPSALIYYRCHGQRDPKRLDAHAHTCSLPNFRVDQVDGVAWEWVQSFLENPAALELGLRKSKAEKDNENEPIRRRLAVLDDLLADNRRQLGRLLDLYLASDLDPESKEFKELLTDRKTRLETTIHALESERAGLVKQIEATALTEEQIKSVLDLAAELAPGLEEAREDFDARRVLIEKLNVQARLEAEGAGRSVRRFVRLSAVFGDSKRIDIVSSTTTGRSSPSSSPAWPSPSRGGASRRTP